jgi:hypothetical protein
VTGRRDLAQRHVRRSFGELRNDERTARASFDKLRMTTAGGALGMTTAGDALGTTTGS